MEWPQYGEARVSDAANCPDDFSPDELAAGGSEEAWALRWPIVTPHPDMPGEGYRWHWLRGWIGSNFAKLCAMEPDLRRRMIAHAKQEARARCADPDFTTLAAADRAGILVAD